MSHRKWLDKTVQMAMDNVAKGGGPFAAIIVNDGEVIGMGTNLVHAKHDPSAHAELEAIREACAGLASTDLSSSVLYASGEPCPMCLGAAYWAKVGTIYYACSKTEALTGAGFGNPLSTFFTDQSELPENRSVPFIQLKTAHSLTPFQKWNRMNTDVDS